jgi:hypothetical protein
MTMHDQRAIAFSTMHDARTFQRSNRASGMLESTIRVRCVYLCGDIFLEISLLFHSLSHRRENDTAYSTRWMPWLRVGKPGPGRSGRMHVELRQAPSR